MPRDDVTALRGRAPLGFFPTAFLPLEFTPEFPASKIVVEQKTGQNLLFLPIDKLMQMTTQPGASVDTTPRASSSTEVTPPAVETPSRREGMRSRDREAGR